MSITSGNYTLTVGNAQGALGLLPAQYPGPYSVAVSTNFDVWNISKNAEGQYFLDPQGTSNGVPDVDYYFQAVDPDRPGAVLVIAFELPGEPAWLLENVQYIGNNTYNSTIQYAGEVYQGGKYWTYDGSQIVLDTLVSVNETSQVFTWKHIVQ